MYDWSTYSYQVLLPIANNALQLVENYLEQHSKVLVVRSDIRYPCGYGYVPDNEHIQRAIAKVIQFFNRKGYDARYMWVMEQDMSLHPHYHCIFLLNGQKTRSASYVFDTVERFWKNTIGSEADGLIDFCYRSEDGTQYENGYIVTRNDGIPEHLLRQIGYMAKISDKGEKHDGLRNFGMSRLS